MAQRVEVPGMGIVEFPDGMSDADMAAAIQKNMPKPADRGAMDKLTGATGERYQTWPERLARAVAGSLTSGAMLPGDVNTGKAHLPASGNIAIPGAVPFGSPESSGERVADLAFMGSPASAVARAGEKGISGVAKALSESKPPAPSAEALRTAATEGFDASKAMGVEFPSAVVSKLGDVLERQLQDKGILPEHAPTAYQTIARLRDAPEGSVVTVSDLHNLRQAFGNAAGSTTHRKDALAGSMGVDLVDKVLQAVAAKGDVAGAAAPASRQLSDAIGNFAAASRSDAVTGREDLAALRAKVANSGQNIDNATRQRFVDIAADQGRASRGFNDAEIDQARRIAEGAPTTNAFRFAGNALGGGGGMGMAVISGLGAAGGALVGGPVGAGVGATIPPILGAGSKAVANALTKREVAALDEMVRRRSPLYEDIWRQAPQDVTTPEGRAAVIRGLLLGRGASQPSDDSVNRVTRALVSPAY